jgi:sulfur carrier protein
MRIIINGEVQELSAGATVEQAIEAIGAPSPGSGLAVAVDGEVIPRGEWPETALAEGQRVEVLHAVQGGA